MARPVRTLMPGSSERCPRGYICGQDVYQGMIQLLQVKSEKSKSVEGWPCSFSGSPGGHNGKGGCFTHALAPNGSNSNASVFLQQVLQSITSLHKLLSALQVGWPLIPLLHAMCPSCIPPGSNSDLRFTPVSPSPSPFISTCGQLPCSQLVFSLLAQQ